MAIVTKSGIAYSNAIENTLHGSNTVSATLPSDCDFIAISFSVNHNLAVPSLTSITVDGVGASAVSGCDPGAISINGFVRLFAYGQVNPNTGTINVVATLSGNVLNSVLVVQGYKNVNQSTPTEGGDNAFIEDDGGDAFNLAPTTTTVDGDYLFANINGRGDPANVYCLDNELSNEAFSNSEVSFVCGDVASTGSGGAVRFHKGGYQATAGWVFVIKQSEGGGGVSLTPSPAQLTFSGYAPTLTRTNNRVLSPANYSLAFATYAPVLTRTNNRVLSPASASLNFTSYASILNRTANRVFTPAPANFTFSTYSLSLVRTGNRVLTPSQANLVFTGYAPTLQIGGSINLTPSPANLTLTGYAPSLVRSGNVNLTPNPASLSFTAYAPALQIGGNVILSPPNGTLTLTGYSPLLVRTQNLTLRPAPAQLNFNSYPPIVSIGRIFNPPAANLTFSGYTPTITITSDTIEYGKIDYYVAKPRNMIYVAKPRNYNHIGQ